jgi:hypothetical protein
MWSNSRAGHEVTEIEREALAGHTHSERCSPVCIEYLPADYCSPLPGRRLERPQSPPRLGPFFEIRLNKQFVRPSYGG